jgi:lysophospholipase L1-like esterase
MARGWNRRVELFASYDVQPGDVVMLGDSITEMTDWAPLLPGVRVHNHGIGGDDTVGVLERLSLVVDARPGTVFLLIGTNDLGKGLLSVDEIADNVETIVARLRRGSPSTVVHLQSVLPRRSRRAAEVDALNRRLQVIAEEQGAQWLDLRADFDRGDGGMDLSLSPDSLHLNADGYRRWAARLAPLVAEARPA